MWQYAATYRAGPSLAPPFHFPFQENHFPFGSVPHSTNNGERDCFASRAQALTSSSNLPARIFASVNVFSAPSCSASERSISRTYGIFPSARIQSQVSRGNFRDSNQLLEKKTQAVFVPRVSSKRVTSAAATSCSVGSRPAFGSSKYRP